MTAHTPRTYEVPEALVAAGYGPTVDLDVLDREVEVPGPFGDWAEKVLFVENTKTLHEVCGDMRLLPRGILASVQLDDESTIVSGLIDADNRIWDKRYNAWVPIEGDSVDTVMLDEDEVAFVARAFREGADEVWFRPYVPKAFVAAPAPPQPEKPAEPDPTAEEVPPGSAIVAVVDPIDEDAVLEMLAVTPGPRVLRRHNGNWFNDPAWVGVLKSVKPPKIVKLDEAQVASVTSQVDRSTVDQDWEPFDADSREQYQIFTASAQAVGRSPYLQQLQNEADERALFALVAVAGRQLTPSDAAATERLKRYWTVGRGAAKIRWGTPGSWRRCYKHLVKYVGPKIAPGYCTNLSQRLGGHGVATHVGMDASITAANPSGVNGYDKGMTFEQSTKGVERDFHGRFAAEGGSNRSERAERRKKSMARHKKNREEKDSKTGDKAKKAAQREELANMTLEIAKLRAAGKTVEAAEMRVRYAQRALDFADTPARKANAQAALLNAQMSLTRAREAAKPKFKAGRTVRAPKSAPAVEPMIKS